MPELPEVETVRRGLEAAIVSKTIREVRLQRANLRIPFPPGFAETLAQRRLEAVTRRAKYLLFHLSGDVTLIAHLGMSGRFTVHAGLPNAVSAHDHVLFSFTDAGALVFNDPRRFGLMTLADTDALAAHPLLAALGPEPLSRAFSARYLAEKLAVRSGPVKPALMDASLVVGVGNIYASEALFAAGIDPRIPAHAAADRAPALAAAIRAVLKSAIASGGSSLRDFLQTDGTPGYFQHAFRVYGREGKLCAVCATPIHLLRQAGRATYYCPSCQK